MIFPLTPYRRQLTKDKYDRHYEVYADEFYDSKQDDTRKRAYKLRAIEKIAAASVGVPERAKSTHLSTLANTATMVKTVADLVSYVKRHDDIYSPQGYC